MRTHKTLLVYGSLVLLFMIAVVRGADDGALNAAIDAVGASPSAQAKAALNAAVESYQAAAAAEPAEDAPGAIAITVAADEVTDVGFKVDNLWIAIAGMLVFMMHLGFAMVESGLCRAKNCVNIPQPSHSH